MEEIMADFNKVILAGHLTKIPDVRTLQNNITVASSGIAVNRKYKDNFMLAAFLPILLPLSKR